MAAGLNESSQTDTSVALANTPGSLLFFPPAQSSEAEGRCERGDMTALPHKPQKQEAGRCCRAPHLNSFPNSRPEVHEETSSLLVSPLGELQAPGQVGSITMTGWGCRPGSWRRIQAPCALEKVILSSETRPRPCLGKQGKL